jgi:hypothetical protein
MNKLTMTAAILIAAGLLAGCQTADPASRSNRSQYRDIYADVTGTSNTVSISVGDGLYASADGGGDKQSNSPVQTTDTKPEVAVGVGGGSAGTGAAAPQSGLTEKIVAALSGWLGESKGISLTPAETAAAAACVDGACEVAPASQ